jgi:hypothetical protein
MPATAAQSRFPPVMQEKWSGGDVTGNIPKPRIPGPLDLIARNFPKESASSPKEGKAQLRGSKRWGTKTLCANTTT